MTHAKTSRIKSPIRRYNSEPIAKFCEICKEYGHEVEPCPHNMRNKQKKVKFGRTWCHICQCVNHNTEDCYFNALTGQRRPKSSTRQSYLASSSPETSPAKSRYEQGYGGRGGYGRSRGKAKRIDFSNTICFACNEPGHLANKCLLLSRLKEQTCKGCSQFGHALLDCPKLREK
eukprot:Gb_11746 [translate_table: standard]